MTAQRTPDGLIRAFLEEGLVELPDRAFDAVRQEIHGTRQRTVLGSSVGPRISSYFQVGLAAVILILIGTAVATVPQDRPGVQPSASPTAGPPASPRIIEPAPGTLEPGPYVIDYGYVSGSDQVPGIKVIVTIPSSDWTTNGTFALERNSGPDDVQADASFVLWRITDVYVDPCTDHTLVRPSPGPGIDDLIEALVAQEGIEGGPIADVMIDGYAGRSVELRVTAEPENCPDRFFTFGNEVEGRAATMRREVVRVYAINVEGGRLTFFARIPQLITPTLGAPEARKQLNSLIDSIDIEP